MRRFLVKALQNAGFDVVSYDNAYRPTSGCGKSRSSFS